ncbi:SRPBCC family protein [Paenibacillus sp. NPDC058174]|uniref:SRPBCC family protein n=1 Tax=Paenibacillus sp. NPDC058174 TaxID=3346366 RepID=UPI0036DE48FF
MYTYNEVIMNCPAETAFRYAREVERWPELLPHYRRTSFEQGGSGVGGKVEMAAYRPFKPLKWPVWWTSDMEVDEVKQVVHYKHIKGVTRNMEVEWRLEPMSEDAVKVSIVHRWYRPPFGRRLIAGTICDQFVHAIADLTLQGLKRHAEQEQLEKQERVRRAGIEGMQVVRV